MRRRFAAVLMILLCLLTACSSKETDGLQAPMDFRAALLQAGCCCFSAALTAGEGTEICEFGMDCVCRTDGTAELTVTAPQSISGIKASCSSDGGEFVFDGMAVGFSDLAGGRVSPVSAPALLASCWADAYIRAVGDEDGLCRVTYEYGYDEAQLIVDCWFEEKNVPIYAEICYNNKTVLKTEISDFSFVSGGNYETTEEDMG